MVRVKDLRQLLSGIDGNFEVLGIREMFTIDLKAKQIFIAPGPEFDKIILPEDKSWNGESERFFPNVGGWNGENEYYYQKFQKGGNNMSYLEELNDLEEFKKQNKPAQESDNRFCPAVDDDPVDDPEFEKWLEEHKDDPDP